MKTYHLKPGTTPANLASDPLARKPHPNTPAARAAAVLTDAIAPAPATAPRLPAPRVLTPLPAVQPLPTPVVDPGKPTLKRGLDVHLEFLMVVAQRDHAAPLAPRKLTREQLVGPVRKWVAEGLVSRWERLCRGFASPTPAGLSLNSRGCARPERPPGKGTRKARHPGGVVLFPERRDGLLPGEPLRGSRARRRQSGGGAP